MTTIKAIDMFVNAELDPGTATARDIIEDDDDIGNDFARRRAAGRDGCRLMNSI